MKRAAGKVIAPGFFEFYIRAYNVYDIDMMLEILNRMLTYH